MATLFDENSNMTALSALNGVTAGPSTAGTNAMNSNHLVNQLLSVKDSRWLQIEVCREYQRGQCSRNEQECKYAHPPAHVDVQNGRVTACYDSIKGRCTRENPKCKYLHPPQHLKDQLLQAGRNNLALKNLLCSQLTQPTALPTMMPGQIAHLVQQPPTQQPLVPTLPFIPSYLTLPAGYHTLISAAPNGGADPYQTPPAILQQLALLQAQSPTNQPQLMLGSPAATAGAQNPLLNQALGAQNLAAMQQASFQQAFLQQLQQQQQLAALYGNSLAGGGAPSPLANFHTVASSMPSSMPNNSITTPESVTSHNSRKRRLDSNLPNGSGHNNSSSLSAHDSTSLFAATGLLNSTHASGTGGGSGSAAGAAASSITPIASATTDSTAGLVALQNQLLLAAAANGNGPIPMKRSALDKNGIAVTSAQTQGLHIYAQHAAQFNPYLMQQALPGYIPVSFAGQLPPRF